MNFDRRAIVLTSIVYTLVLFMFLHLGFKTPLPLPAEQGILINFGDYDEGMGAVEPAQSETVEQAVPIENEAVPEVTEIESESAEEVVTQDFEEAPAVVPKPTQKEEEKEVEKEPEEVKPQVNTRALYGGRRNDTQYTGSEGESGEGGNQGSITGSENTSNRSKGLSSGGGVQFNLAGRGQVALPTPEFNHQQEGVVVVEITVDRSGKVISAVPGVKGSTTLDSYLLNVAKKAALASRFTAKEDAALYQKGTIRYVFRLN